MQQTYVKFIHSFIQSFFHSFIHSFIHPLIYLFIYLKFIYLFITICLLFALLVSFLSLISFVLWVYFRFHFPFYAYALSYRRWSLVILACLTDDKIVDINFWQNLTSMRPGTFAVAESSPTWDGVIQEESENPTYQHTGTE